MHSDTGHAGRMSRRARIWVLTGLLACAPAGCGADTPADGSAGAVFEAHRRQALECREVCRIDGWHFVTVRVPLTGSGEHAEGRARLMAAQRVLAHLRSSAARLRQAQVDRAIVSRRGRRLLRETFAFKPLPGG